MLRPHKPNPRKPPEYSEPPRKPPENSEYSENSTPAPTKKINVFL